MSEPTKKKRCRHELNSWLIAGGAYEWCYRCGAIRKTRESGPAQVTPSSTWLRPTGPNGRNPWSHLWATGYGLRSRDDA